MLLSLELGTDFSEGRAHSDTRPLISTTHPTSSRFANCVWEKRFSCTIGPGLCSIVDTEFRERLYQGLG
jgi:hypothetical protein